MIAAISSQPREPRRCAIDETATSRLRVEKLTEMNAPSAMMNMTTPIEPNIRPTFSVLTKPLVASWMP